MRRGIVLLACALLIPALATAQTLFIGSQDPFGGAGVFNAKGCVKCHAIRGVGGTIGPDLARTERPRSFYDLAAALWNHAPTMAARMHQLGIARPHLDSREAGDLAGYLFTLNYFERQGNAVVGRRLFAEKRCVACHRVGSTGGTIGPRLDGVKPVASPIFLAAAMWNHGPQMAELMQRENITRPSFKGSELVDLITYLNSVSPRMSHAPLYVLPGRADEGGRLFTQKGCVDCHSVGGAADPAKPSLAERALHMNLTEFAAAMWNKAPRMQQAMQSRLGGVVSQLQPQEMADIVGFLYAARYFRQAGDPRKGVIVTANKGCLHCHGLYGERGKVASDLTRAAWIETSTGVLSALWNHTFIADPRRERERTPWPLFRGEEMADLVAYLRSLRRPASGS
jgi:mono/diheme cytochrome c family protein